MMDNLLAKTLQFLFIPEAALAIIFLVIFFVLFAFGVYKTFSCKRFLRNFSENAEKNFEEIHAKMPPELFIKKNLEKISATENTLEELPNAFVSIGIIATFLGLGVAIQGAAELLQTDKLELAKLTAVLGVIAFKFQTSVWGISFSLIFRNFVLENYWDFRREIVDDLYNKLYALERDSVRTLLEKQNEFISAHLDWQKNFEEKNFLLRSEQYEKLFSAQQNFFSELKNLIDEQHKNSLANDNRLFEELTKNFSQIFTENRNNIIHQLETFENSMQASSANSNKLLAFLVKNFDNFIKNSASFAENLNSFQKSVSTFAEEVNKFKTDFSELVKREFDDLKKINENLGRLQADNIEKIHAEHEANIFYTTQELDKLHQKFYLDANRFTQETQNALDKILEKTLNSVHDEYIREAHEIRAVISQINETLDEIHENVLSVNREFFNEQKNFVASWNNAAAKIGKTMETFSAASVEESKRLENSHKNISAIALELKNQNAENIHRLENIAQNNAENFNTTLKNMTTSQVHFVQTVDSFTKDFHSVNTAMQENISKNFTQNQMFAENLTGEISNLKNSLEKLTSLTGEKSDANNGTLQEVLKSFAALQEELSDFNTTSNNNAKQIQETLEKIAVQSRAPQRNLPIIKPAEQKKVDKPASVSFGDTVRKFLRDAGGNSNAEK